MENVYTFVGFRNCLWLCFTQIQYYSRERASVCVVIEYNGNNQLRKQMSAEKKKKEEVKEVKTNTELLRS